MRGPEPVASEDRYFADIETERDEIVIIGPNGGKLQSNELTVIDDGLKGKYNRHTRRKLKAKQRQQTKRDRRHAQ